MELQEKGSLIQESLCPFALIESSGPLFVPLLVPARIDCQQHSL